VIATFVGVDIEGTRRADQGDGNPPELRRP
jgi:hypothetical protein